jgi:hypothetical protein
MDVLIYSNLVTFFNRTLIFYFLSNPDEKNFRQTLVPDFPGLPPRGGGSDRFEKF